MNITLTNIWLDNHGGTEVYIRDLAVALLARGVQVEVYSPVLGKVADEIKDAGIHVVDSVADLMMTPDLIHAQHYVPTTEVMSRFPAVPAVYFLHDRTHIIDNPPKSPLIVKHIAVDYNCLDKLIIDNGIPRDQTDVVFNWVDASRFKLRERFADKPKKALVFSNYGSADNYTKAIKEACDQRGIKLDGLGYNFGNPINKPEHVLWDYDLVFAKAKAAMEAMATGAAVILVDYRGLGPMVSMRNIGFLRKYNFGMKTLIKPINARLIVEEIDKYDSGENLKVAQKIRDLADFDMAVEHICEVYQSAINQAATISSKENFEHRRIIAEYGGLKSLLVHNKLHRVAEENAKNLAKAKSLEKCVEENKVLIKSQADSITGLMHTIEVLRKSNSFRLGRFLSLPYRILKKILHS